MIYRIYVEKKAGFDREAQSLLGDVREILGVAGVERIRILNRYDTEELEGAQFRRAIGTVFSDPQTDTVTEGAELTGARVFAVELLPEQFDRCADSAAQCIQLATKGGRPVIRTAKVYAVYGSVTEEGLAAIKNYVIDPAQSREASLAIPETLKPTQPVPAAAETLHGFLDLDGAGLAAFAKKYALAMSEEDIGFCQDYFRAEYRDPTLTEIRLIDTCRSEKCLRTALFATIDGVEFEDELLQSAYDDYLAARRELGRSEPVSLMDLGTIAASLLKRRGLLDQLDDSEEGNACSVKIKVEVDGELQNWLLLFQSEMHYETADHSFRAANAIGGALRDPLSGRGYAYAAMRVTGTANPLRSEHGTARRGLVAAAAEASDYGNRLGLAMGQVDEMYHEGFADTPFEAGAVVAATPAENVRRERPAAGDKVVLLGDRTGRVRNGNPTEARKLQRLFRNRNAMLLVKRCTGVGVGGMSVALGELADGIEIDLDAVPVKEDGLNDAEILLSESQERMAVVVEADKADEFLYYAEKENLEAAVVATVTQIPRLVAKRNGKTVVSLSRTFLDSKGTEKRVTAAPAPCNDYRRKEFKTFAEEYRALAQDPNVCSKRGLSERFDSTIGSGTVLAPFGGTYQATPPQAMVHLVPVEKGHTDTVSYMSWGGNPDIAEKSPYHAAYLSVVESVSKLVAAGASFKDVYLSLRQSFPEAKEPARRGQLLAALLGAFRAQTELGVAAIGGKNFLSETFKSGSVPPALLSFAVTTGKVREVVSPEFKEAGHKVVLLLPEYDEHGLPVPSSLLANFRTVTNFLRIREAVAVYTPTYGGVAEGVLKMCLGNRIGFRFSDTVPLETLFGYRYGAFILELEGNANVGIPLGETIAREIIERDGESVSLYELQKAYEGKLEPVYPCKASAAGTAENVTCTARSSAGTVFKTAKPKVLIPVFSGTNCETDAAKAFADAGAKPEVFVVRNRTQEDIARSSEKFASLIGESQIVFLPGGFSSGSGKYIAEFFRGEAVRERVQELLERHDGLMGGICNGFQALVRLGLLPFGKFVESDENPVLTRNDIGRHQSRIVNVRVASVKSPWLSGVNAGDIFSVPVSHGEGKFVASDELLSSLAQNGQIMTQYVDPEGNATMDVRFNPSGSANAIEGILSPDGRVFGKMGHAERKGGGLYRNVVGKFDMQLFESAVKYFR